MNLKNINDLINVRNYISMSVGNGSIDKKMVNYLSNLLLLLDKKILSILTDDEFKEYVDYKDLQNVIDDVRRISNIKSTLK